MDATGITGSWNWAAFFGGAVWLLYRKIYWRAIREIPMMWCPVVRSFLLAMHGNRIYRLKIEEVLCRTAYLEGDERIVRLKQLGGVSLAPVVLGVVFVGIVVFGMVYDYMINS
jgi:hypothetical protein